MKVVIAAAGTGGHINPGIAIANKIMKEEPNSKVIFVGTANGLEKNLVPRASYELKTINSFGISRSLSIKNIKRLIKTIGSIGEAKKILKNFKPDIVIGTGGYICISVCMAANRLNIPYIIHESNVLPGVATRLMSKKAKKILVGFEEAIERLPNASKVAVTGTPTKVKKISMSDKEINSKKERLGFKATKPLVLVFGGSQGAQSINESIQGIIEQGKNKDYQIMWAPGPDKFDEVKKEFREKGIDINKIDNAKILPYIYDMEDVMNIADIIVARSGAMTVTEIENVGKPAIFIPFPYAAENHQEYNARVLEKNGAAKVILNKDLTSEVLHDNILNLTSDKNKLLQMGKNANKLAINNVEDKIYKEIIQKGS